MTELIGIIIDLRQVVAAGHTEQMAMPVCRRAAGEYHDRGFIRRTVNNTGCTTK